MGGDRKGGWEGRGGRRGGKGVGAPFNFLPPGATYLVTPLTVTVLCETDYVDLLILADINGVQCCRCAKSACC